MSDMFDLDIEDDLLVITRSIYSESNLYVKLMEKFRNLSLFERYRCIFMRYSWTI
jgi:hypothetical protein